MKKKYWIIIGISSFLFLLGAGYTYWALFGDHIDAKYTPSAQKSSDKGVSTLILN